MTIFFADNAFIVIFVRFKAIAAADRPTPLERDSTRPNDTNSRRDKEPVRSGYEHGDKAATTCMRTALHTPKSLFTVVLLLLAAAVEAQTLTVGTYNMRNDNAGDARNGNGWQRRCPVICEQVEWIDFDIFGAQEIKKNQLDDLLAALPEYDYVGVGRDDGIHGGEHEPIFYKRDRFRLLDAGDFWISQTPDVAGSKGWDAALPRVCSYARLQDRETKLRFWYFNLHMDHIGVEARREGAKLIVQKVREMCGGEPVIITGDFNVDQNNEIYQTFVTSGLLKDSYVAAEKRFARNGTFNSFKPDLHTESRIDHIFVSPAFAVRNYAVLTDGYWTPREDAAAQKGEAAPQEISLRSYERRCPSDHYPVAARIEAVKRR